MPSPGRRDPYGLGVEPPARAAPAEAPDDWLNVDIAAEARAAADAAVAAVTAAPAARPAPVPAAPAAAKVVGVEELDFSEEALDAVSVAQPLPPPPVSAAQFLPPPPVAGAPEPIELPEVELEEEEEEEIELAPMHAFVPPATETGHQPEPARALEPRPTVVQRVPAGGIQPADGGEALLREALSKASLEVIERIAWEVVPVLAETIIREQVDRLVRERQAK